MKVKVGLIGPRKKKYGIGQYVAREILNYPLSELAAIMSTSAESLKKALKDLNSREDVLNKFNGEGYVLDKKFFEKIDLAVICSPAETHEDYIRQALNANQHVLVEKPLLYNPGAKSKDRIKKAYDLVKLANSKGLFLATNCQRAAVVQVLYEKLGLPLQPYFIDIELKIKSKGKLESPKDLFDLIIAHPISILVKYGLTDFKSVKIEDYSEKYDSSSSSLIIEGSSKATRFNIKLQQSKEILFASMVIKVDKCKSIQITMQEDPKGKIRVEYLDGKKKVYSEDHLKTSVSRMIDAVYYKDKKHKPLITNTESYLIYALQEKLRELLF